MEFISWNVNGLRACMKKGFMDFFNNISADFFCIQETKMQQSQLEFEFAGYHLFMNDAEKKGYSGTAILAKTPPISCAYGIGTPAHDTEGRVITLEYDNFFLVNVYTPNSQNALARLPYRMEWEDAFKQHLLNLNKPIILCGDLNVAHKEIDLKNPKTNRKNAGFTDDERAKFQSLLDAGFTDSFRHLYPDLEGAYTWWSFISNARERNAGWRIDYFVVSNSIAANIIEAKIHADIYGSDHCPVGLTLKIQQ